MREEIRSRYWNPNWIEGQMGEGYAGARQVARTIDNLWGWQVMSPETVADYMWEEFKQIYVDDKYQMGMRQWFDQHNPYAFQSLTGRMLEVIRKGYWDASPETIASLAQAYQDSVSRFGPAGTVHLETPQFRNFMAQYLPKPVVVATVSISKEIPRITQPQTRPQVQPVLPSQPEPEAVVERPEPQEPPKQVKAYELEQKTEQAKGEVNLIYAGIGVLVLVALMGLGLRRKQKAA